MTHSLFSAISVSVLASAVLSAGPGEISGSANRGTVITADIKTDTTWTRAQSPVAVSGAIHIAEGATLTIEHGVAVKFASGNGSGLTVNGRLVVAGTAAEPVYFSSSRDTGESISRFPVNLPGAGASSGDWAGIRFTGSRGDSSLEYAVVRYAAVAVRIDGRGGATVSHSILRDSAIGLSVDNDSASVRASDNRFVANGTALSGTAPSRCASLASGCGVIAEPSGFAAASGLRPRVAPQGNKMPSFATVPTGWTASTYAAASFAQPTSPVFGLPNEVQVQISSAQGEINRPPQYQGQAYGYQGSRHSVAGTGVGDTIEAELYVPASLGNSSAGNAASYLWANGSNGSAETDYAIAGFTNSTGHGGFAVWDENLGAFADLPVGTVPVIYNGWNTIEIVFSGSTYDYYINGVEAYSSSNSYGSTAMSSATVDAVNFFDPTTSFTGLNYTVTWADTPTAPVITSSTSLPSTLVGANYSQGLSVQAQSGVTYTWSAPSGLPPGIGLTSAGILQGSATTPGTFTFTVSVTNGVQTTQQNETIIVYGPLSITTSSLPFGIAGQSYGPVQFAASGGSGIQNQRWTAPGLTGFTLSTAGVFAGTTPANSQSVTVTVTDSVTGQTASSTYNVVVYPVLSITSTLPVGVAGAPYGPVQLTATGGSGNGNQTWTPATPSAGLTLSTTGVLSGTTPQSSTSFSITATDKLTSQTATVTYTLTVSAPPLVVSGPSAIPEVAVGGAISGSFSASGGTAPYTFTSTNLPPGATLGMTSGTLGGTAATAGIFPFTVNIADSGGKSSTLSSSLSVLGVSAASLPSATTTTNFSFTFSASGGTGTYTWTASALPGGLTLGSTGVLSGTPSSSGSFTFTVTVHDGVTTASTQASLTIASAVIPVSLPGGTLSPGQANVPYTGTINAGGGTAPYTYSFSGGVLPTGVSIQSSGQISGTPTVAGSFSFTVQAKDSLQKTASAQYSIVIAPAPLVLSSGTTLPNGIVGSDYGLQQLVGSGGVSPFTYALTAGSLPPGLNFSNGQITGIPSGSGTFPFTVTITDSAGSTATISLSILVNPAQANLLLSDSSVTFNIMSGATALPPGNNITVRSSVILQNLNYTYALNPSVPWVSATGGTSTPNTLQVTLTSSALSQLPAGTPYTTALVVTCASTSPCAGQTQSVNITLNVSAPPAQLSVSTTLLAFTSTTANPATTSLPLTVQNSGGGNLAISSITPADGWVSVSGTPSSIASGPGVPVTVSVNPAGLPVGYNSSSVTVTSAAGSITVPVTLVISQNTSMSLSPTTQQFSLAAGGTVTPNSGSFQVSVNGTQPITWSASLIPGANWLALNSTSGTSSSGSAGVANYTLNNSAISALTPGTYFGTIQVTAAGVNNSPQNYQVQLLVGPSTALPVPNPNPSGFVLQTGVALTQAVSVGVASASNPTTSIPYQASASTTDGANWLTVTPAAGNTSASSPAASTVTASAAGLAPGVYYGLISYAFSTAAVRSVNITFFVTGPASSVVFGESPRATSTCTPKQLIPTQIGLVSNFSQLATLSVPLKILLTDNCGNPVPSGQVTTTFSNGDSSITLTPVDSVSGIFTGTWTPLGISNQVNVTATATGGGLTAGSSRINGAVTAYAGPVLSQNAVLNVYNPLIGGAIAPGDILQIYGSNLAATVATSSKLPLTTTLGSTSVSIGGTPVPLYYVSPTQINAQAPFELTAGNQYQVVVNVNGALTAPATISVSPAQPGIAGYQNGQIKALHLDGTLVSEASPAVAGTYVVFYLAGLGPTDTPVADGAASPVTPLAHPVNMPTLTLNGVSQPYQFVGLTPGLVGLYQINFLVPSTLAGSGDSTLVISQSGSPSNTVILPIQ